MLKFIKKSSLQLTIEASDQRGQTSAATVVIKISRDEQPPRFEGAPYKPGQVSENSANNSGVYTVKCSDPDSKGGIQYEMIGLYPAEQFFQMDRDKGVVRIINNLKSDPLRLMSYTVNFLFQS